MKTSNDDEFDPLRAATDVLHLCSVLHRPVRWHLDMDTHHGILSHADAYLYVHHAPDPDDEYGRFRPVLHGLPMEIHALPLDVALTASLDRSAVPTEVVPRQPILMSLETRTRTDRVVYVDHPACDPLWMDGAPVLGEDVARRLSSYAEAVASEDLASALATSYSARGSGPWRTLDEARKLLRSDLRRALSLLAARR